jgi:hypothetical protein
MKRATVILCALALLGIACYAWARSTVVSVVQGAAAASCSESSNEVNSARDTVQANSNSMNADIAYVFAVTADCTGGLKTAYVYDETNGTGQNVKVCIYNYDGSGAPSASDTLVACSDAVASAVGAGWRSASFSSGNVTSGGNYWMAIFNSTAGQFNIKYGSSPGLYYMGSSGYYASNPANLGGMSGASSASVSPVSAYVTIGASW